ncbi:ABC transporter permease, partial [Streptomyces sp. NPDC088178]
MSTTPTPQPLSSAHTHPAAPPLSPARTLATAARVLRQLAHDPRTVALLLLVPVVLITLLRYVFDG